MMREDDSGNDAARAARRPGPGELDRPDRGAPRRASAGAGAALLALAALCLVAGCRREEVSHFQVAKEQPAAPSATSAATPAGAGGAMQGEVPPPPSPGKNALHWTLPKGWTQSLSGGMRYATLKPPVAGRVEGSVVVLPGPAGGDVANVNRWRGQIGLPPVDEAAVAAMRKVVGSKAGQVELYDFTSEGQKKSRVLAAVVVAAGNSWFLKLSGDIEPVAASRADFIHLLESLRLEDAN